jgi:hypothetical protein
MEMTVGKKHGELESEREKRKEGLGKKEKEGWRIGFGMGGEI